MWRKQIVQSSNDLDSIVDHEEDFSYGPPWSHCLGGFQDRLLGGPLGLLGLCHTAPDGVRRKDYGGGVLG
jgi:hypothetical protein